MSSVPSALYEASPGNFVSVPIASIPFTSGLTTPLQASVANPALGYATIFVNNSGDLSLTGSTGNTVKFLDSPADFSQNMNGNSITGIASESFQGDIVIHKVNNGANVQLGGTLASGAASTILIGGSNAGGSNNVVIGSANSVNNSGQYQVAIGENISTSGGGFCVTLGGGNTGITNPQIDSVAIGNDMTLGSGTGGICLGSGAGIGSANNAIAMGTSAVNNTSSSCLIGDPAIANIRSNNSSLACDLGTASAPFKACWLRDSQPASKAGYSMYAPVTLANSTAETALLSGSSVGSLLYSAGQSVGSVIRMRLNLTYSGLVTDQLTLRFKVNGTTVLTQSLGLVALSAVAGMSQAEFVVQASTVQASVSTSVNGLVGEVANNSAAYNPAIANTFSLTGQWSAASASDSVTVNYAFSETLYAQ